MRKETTSVSRFTLANGPKPNSVNITGYTISSPPWLLVTEFHSFPSTNTQGQQDPEGKYNMRSEAVPTVGSADGEWEDRVLQGFHLD